MRNMGAYLRKMAMDGYCIRLDLGDLKKVVSLMRYASNNLNQYAKKAHDKLYKTCPNCGRKVGTYDGRGTMNIVCRCNKCVKRVIYYPETGKIEIKKLPVRETSSGMTFF